MLLIRPILASTRFGALFALSMLSLGVPSGTFAENEPHFTDGSAQRWVHRIEKLIPPGWKVSRRSDWLLIEREKPVDLTNVINAPAAVANRDARVADPATHSHPYQIRLRFGPRLSQDEYDRLAVENAASTVQAEKLRESLNGINHKFNQYVPETAEQRQLIETYNMAVGKLPWSDLPDCYTTDDSIYYASGWPDFLTFAKPEVAEECQQVETSLLRLFGVYDPRVAQGLVRPNSIDDPRARAARRGGVEVISSGDQK